MAFNIQQFRSEMRGDGARPNLFECTLTFPAGVGDVAAPYTFMARSAQLPGSTVNSIPVNYFGRELKFAGNRTFPEWTVVIINDESFNVRNAFERWLNFINSHAGNLRAPAFLTGDGGYQSDGKIVQFGKKGNRLKKYKFIGMFPIDVSPIEMDWGANDAIEEFSVTFAYQWWESDTTDGQSADRFVTSADA
jgi:hypothetical protein